MKSDHKGFGQRPRRSAKTLMERSGADWSKAARAIGRLSEAGGLDEIIDILRQWCRDATGASGIAVLLRDEDECYCIAQDAIEVLWQGKRFAQGACVSGWTMLNRQSVGIADIYLDDRVPHEIYRETFVKSMAMVPIGGEEPLAALGAYWAGTGHPDAEEMAILQAIAEAASTALARGQLLSEIIELNRSLKAQVSECTRRLDEAQQLVLQTQKINLVGQLAGTVAHDINNLLTPIMMSLDRILRAGSQSRPTLDHAQLAMEAAEKAGALVHRLLRFARKQPLRRAVVDLHSLLKGMEPLLALSIGNHIQLQIAAPPGIPNILAEQQQLEIAILNLAINARDAMPDGGKLFIGLSNSSDGQAIHSGSGSFVRLYVKDEGSGMDETTRRKALEPYFTTKPQGSGTGLGLSMVHDTVQKAGGMINIISELGVGTEVSLWLPVTNASITRAEVAAVENAEIELKGIAIVVDDHALVRKGIASVLCDEGYEVMEVESAESCLDQIRNGLHPDLIIADHLMSGMSGLDLAHEVFRYHPQIAFILISGHDRLESAPFDIVRMNKPFRDHELQTSIALARRRAGRSRRLRKFTC